ncbi:Cell cycle checkpoint control protein rad9b [Podila epicladia]|nr:Cell cycle checkpoint control protein rad9b [Podila epicladia]
MKAIIPSISIKGTPPPKLTHYPNIATAFKSAFQAVLACLLKIGDDVTIEARPNSLALSTINITRSAFAIFSFTSNFFESYTFDANAENIVHDAAGPYLRCKVLSKALVSACKVRGNVEQKIEKCGIFMESAEGVGENCFIKIHKLLYESCLDNLQVIYSKESFPSSWRLTTPALMGLMDNFSSKADEMSMECNQDGMILSTCKSTHEIEGVGSKRIGTTRIQLHKNSIDNYRLQDNIEIMFPLKEFKAIATFATTLRLPLDGYFDSRSRPMLLSVTSENIISASFALATIVGENEIRDDDQPQRVPGTDIHGNGYGQSPSQSQAGQGYGQGQGQSQGQGQGQSNLHMDFSQPENALYFDDDSNWEKELGDFDMEEAMSSSISTQAAAPVGNNNATQLTVLTDPNQSSIQHEPQEIEERDFLQSEQPGPKRRRFIFNDDSSDDDE